MIIGLGSDLCNIERIQKSIDRFGQRFIDRIFTPFFTTKPVGEGPGLGLDLAWRIICEKHHGNIYVESKPGDTTFIVTLPVHAPAPEEILAGTTG